MSINDHFADVRKMVSIGSGSERDVDNLMLTRYACYLVAQNGDSRKPEISFAQNLEEGRFSCYNERTVPLLHPSVTLGFVDDGLGDFDGVFCALLQIFSKRFCRIRESHYLCSMLN